MNIIYICIKLIVIVIALLILAKSIRNYIIIRDALILSEKGNCYAWSRKSTATKPKSFLLMINAGNDSCDLNDNEPIQYVEYIKTNTRSKMIMEKSI